MKTVRTFQTSRPKGCLDRLKSSATIEHKIVGIKRLKADKKLNELQPIIRRTISAPQRAGDWLRRRCSAPPMQVVAAITKIRGLFSFNGQVRQTVNPRRIQNAPEQSDQNQSRNSFPESYF